MKERDPKTKWCCAVHLADMKNHRNEIQLQGLKDWWKHLDEMIT